MTSCKRLILILSFILIPIYAVADNQPLIVSGQMPWKPFLMKDSSGKVYGIMYDILKEAADANGYTLKYIDYPWSRAIKNLENGKIDIMCGIFWNKKRAKIFNFSSPVVKNELRIFTSEPFKLERMIDLQGMQGDCIRGGSYGNRFDTFKRSGRIKIIEVTNVNTAIKRQIRGYSDFFIGTYIDTMIKLHERGLTNRIIPLDYVITTEKAYFAFPKETKKKYIYEDIKKNLNRMLYNGTVEKIVQSYLKYTAISSDKVRVKDYIDLRNH